MKFVKNWIRQSFWETKVDRLWTVSLIITFSYFLLLTGLKTALLLIGLSSAAAWSVVVVFVWFSALTVIKAGQGIPQDIREIVVAVKKKLKERS